MYEEFFEKGDKMAVIHLTNCRKQQTYGATLEAYTPQGILEDYKNTLVSRLQKDNYEIVFEEVDLKWKNPKKQLALLAGKLNCTYLFMGAFGRKGEK